MKFSEKWLREWVNPPASTEELVERLTMSGLEVESVSAVAGTFEGVCVAAISEVRPHPNAERLRICTAEVGNNERLQIVTGAANVRDGMRVPLARVGAVLPGERLIARSRLRGVESDGMLCSTVELGMSETSEGVLELPADAPLGADIRKYLQLDDVSIELNITPNRGDCLSVAGIAREVGAEYGAAVHNPSIPPVSATIGDELPVTIEAQDDCPRYVGRVIRGIDPSARTPIWMVERLRRCGLRSIHPVVDITNYVMLELGQPMHAFDVAQLQGGINVRRARPGEALQLLDGHSIELSADTLVIADDRGPLAMAGVMGGAGSGVTAGTNDIFIESAYFDPQVVARRARHYKLQTDSSYRFERGVDHELQRRAAERASGLVLEICGGRAGRLIERVSEGRLPGRRQLILRRERLRRVLGYFPAADEIPGLLDRLGMQPESTADGWRVHPPSWRPDIDIEADVIEEVVRIAGYDNVPARMPGGVIHLTNVPAHGVSPLTRLREVLVQRGYQEAITYSFIGEAINRLVRPDCQPMVLANPISSDMAVMRSSLWPGLIAALAYNQSRQQERVRLFEIGRSFEKKDGEVQQINRISAIVSGSHWPEQWSASARPVDFFDVKGDLEAVLTTLAPGGEFDACPADEPALHPGQAAEYICNGKPVAVFGALHPDLTAKFGLRAPVFVFDVAYDWLGSAEVPRYRPLSKFPSVRRDLSFTVNRALPVKELLNCIRESAPPILRHLQLFDVYEGEGIDSGKKSVALGLIFQGTSSTLVDEDIDAQVAAIVERLTQRFGVGLRDS